MPGVWRRLAWFSDNISLSANIFLLAQRPPRTRYEITKTAVDTTQNQGAPKNHDTIEITRMKIQPRPMDRVRADVAISGLPLLRTEGLLRVIDNRLRSAHSNRTNPPGKRVFSGPPEMAV